jgi:UDP-N-acetylglucosamine 2-epimerase (non-hydrolysing)
MQNTATPIVVHLIAAARPNFMKIAPLYHALKLENWCTPQVVHTGQHYDPNMSDAFFKDLGMPTPAISLEVGSGSHAEQTGGVMIAYEKICDRNRPEVIVVVGDVNSTAACALVGAKLWIPVVHLEAGLRSRDRRMPEEINRLVTDAIADLLWTPSPDADENLKNEGIAPARIERVGNIMIDSYELVREQIQSDQTRAKMGLSNGSYGVVTLHRPSNVDDPDALKFLVAQIIDTSKMLPLVFSIHPRTNKRLTEFGLMGQLLGAPGVKTTEPLGYIQFMNLVSGARVAITDSGGIQEETTYLGIPCLTLRDSTERPITVIEGSNRLVKPTDVQAAVADAISGRWQKARRPQFWDGHTAKRCVESLHRFMMGLRTPA